MKIPPLKKIIYCHSIATYDSILYADYNTYKFLDFDEDVYVYINQPKNLIEACTKIIDRNSDINKDGIYPHLRQPNVSVANMLDDIYQINVIARDLLSLRSVSE